MVLYIFVVVLFIMILKYTDTTDLSMIGRLTNQQPLLIPPNQQSLPITSECFSINKWADCLTSLQYVLSKNDYNFNYNNRDKDLYFERYLEYLKGHKRYVDSMYSLFGRSNNVNRPLKMMYSYYSYPTTGINYPQKNNFLLTLPPTNWAIMPSRKIITPISEAFIPHYTTTKPMLLPPTLNKSKKNKHKITEAKTTSQIKSETLPVPTKPFKLHSTTNQSYNQDGEVLSETAFMFPSIKPSDALATTILSQPTTLSTTTIYNETSETNYEEKATTDTVFTSTSDTSQNVTNYINGEKELIEYRTFINDFTKALDKFERKFYMVTFNKLMTSSPEQRRENGISFVQSGLFLYIYLLAISTETDADTKAEIDQCLGINYSDEDRSQMIKEILSDMPNASNDLVFRWSSRLALGVGRNVSQVFRDGPASALKLQIENFNGSETPEVLAKILNRMVEKDSKGAIHDTFDAEDMSGGVSSVLLTTLYLRAQWRSAPTVLNGSRPFRDSEDAPQRTVRMIRINDIMRYADLRDCDAEAIEVFYATPGLSLLILVPRGRSIRSLASYTAEIGLQNIIQRMSTMRVGATLPIYTLRMTLLLPNKLQTMGITRLLDVNNATEIDFRVSHGVQRLMFWAEAGRNAFKDDGIEWDVSPELEMVVDRPYLFFVRWQNLTLMNGNFVL